jgi:hypothetical protein
MACYDCGFGSDGTVLSYHCPHVAGKGDAMNTLKDRYNKGTPLTDLEVCVLNYGSDADAEQLAALETENIMLKAENIIMYSAILEASTLGNNAALRCQVELQRIAKKDAALEKE